MNGTGLCLNVDIKVNLDYPDWGAIKADTLGNNRDIDAWLFLMELIKFHSVVDGIIWRKDLCKVGGFLKI